LLDGYGELLSGMAESFFQYSVERIMQLKQQPWLSVATISFVRLGRI